jgi:hypothetical protein
MNSFLLDFSNLLMSAFFWIGIPFLLVGMLLVLGFQLKHWVSSVISMIGLLGLSCFGLGLSIKGLITGEALTISRHSGIVLKSESPFYYWLATSFWLVLSSLPICFCIWVLFRLIKKNLAKS